MSRRLIAISAMTVIAISLVGIPAWAQKAVVKIPFSFVAGDREPPAGTYNIRPEMDTQSRLTLRNQDTGDSIMVSASRDSDGLSVRPEVPARDGLIARWTGRSSPPLIWQVKG